MSDDFIEIDINKKYVLELPKSTLHIRDAKIIFDPTVIGELKARIQALEGVVEEIKEHVEFVESGVDGVEGDIYKQNFYLDIKRTLSQLEEV